MLFDVRHRTRAGQARPYKGKRGGLVDLRLWAAKKEN
jgi:hypothetical protein